MESTRSLLEKIEVGARTLLWFAIASACVIIPIEYVNAKRDASKAEADAQEQTKKAEARIDELEKANKPKRLTLASMGSQMSVIIYSHAQGELWFTNVSDREGPLCVVAHAQDPSVAVKTAVTNPECAEVKPYSSVHLEMQFAGGDLSAACPKQDCTLTFTEAAEGHDEASATIAPK